MSHDLIGKDLQDLFVTDAWQDCFSALSESLGFSLHIFSRDGKMLYGPRRATPFCHRLRASTPVLAASCNAHCQPFMENALETGRSDVFKCHLKIVSFVVPLRHKAEHAVILGQGSFSSLEDFYECLEHLHAAGIDVTAFSAPTVFTSYPKAWMVCDFTTDAVRGCWAARGDRVLGSELKSLKKFIGGWEVPARGGAPVAVPALAAGTARAARSRRELPFLSVTRRCEDTQAFPLIPGTALSPTP